MEDGVVSTLATDQGALQFWRSGPLVDEDISVCPDRRGSV
ncbi:hypothetical protein PARPLA_02289 [Rhodobacteraceae bacterium THAF1]|nr:hypothetical protein FIU81_11625 [Palleronia sp. THAF1]VDC26754.1 hypothetical protein PARPLA_02289 [Rhodobacteraceae bacterium THAF1]